MSKNLKTEIKEVVNTLAGLGNLEFTVEDELEFCKSIAEKRRNTLKEIKELAFLIVNDDDKPACVNDDDCPLNGGVGYDSHCNMSYPFIIGKQILEKCEKAV